jgi:hypothetical protein
MADRPKPTRWMRAWYVPITAAGLALLAVIAVFRMESSAPNYDPQYMRVIVERTIRYGGSYYVNGIHNKGPLEPFVYELAARLGGDGGFWFVISLFALAAAGCVGVAAALFTVRSGGSVLLGSSVAAAAIVHLTLSDADYAGVLYARNMTVALLSIGFAVAAFDPAWSSDRRRVASVVVVGITTGLAVQTLVTACFTASPVLLWAMWARRDELARRVPAWLAMPVVSACALASAPVYYRLFGPWRAFVDGWWVQARFMSEGTGRDLASQFSLGWDRFLEYYGERPELVVVLVIWLVTTAWRWRTFDRDQRALRLLPPIWFLGAWIELVLSQRYSSHYFSVLAVPTIMLLATVIADVGHGLGARLPRGDAARSPRLTALLPLGAAIVALYAGGLAPFGVGLAAVAQVDSTDDFVARRAVGIDGRTHMLRAALDLVSEEDDPLLMWTSYPWPYLNYERVSATRYIWKTFLLGEIYLGKSGPEYVVPGTWDRFAEDLDATNPTAFIVESVNPVEPGTPFASRVARDFTEVFDDGAVSLSYRNDLASWLRSPAVSGEHLTIAAGSTVLSATGCTRIDAQLSFAAAASEPIRLEFGRDPDGGSVGASIELQSSDDGRLLVESNRIGVGGYAGTFEVSGERGTLSVVVGARSAVVVVDGWIVGAVGVEPGAPVTLIDGGQVLDPLSVMRSRPPTLTGC